MFKNHPKGLLAAALSNMGERFGYYIMNAVLTLFLCSKFGLSDETGGLIYSIFYAGIYVLSLVGGIIADKSQNYKGTIQSGLLIMALGYALLSIPILSTPENISWLLPITCVSLFLIAFGNGLFKGNLQAIVGQMYDNFEADAAKISPEALENAKAKRDSGFQIFYVFINIGGLIAPFIAPALRSWWLKENGFTYNASLPALCHEYIEEGAAMAQDQIQNLNDLVMKVSGAATNDLSAFCTQYLDVFNTGIHYSFIASVIAMLISLAIFLATKRIFPNPGKKEAKTVVDYSEEEKTALAKEIKQKMEEKNVVDYSKEEKSALAKEIKQRMEEKIVVDYSKEEKSALAKEIKQRMYALFAVLGVVIFFWFSFHQNGTSLSLFARDFVNTEVIAPEIWQAVNPFFVIVLTPVIMWIFAVLAKKGKSISTPKKIAIGMAITGIAYLVISAFSYFKGYPSATEFKTWSDATKVPFIAGPGILIILYFLLTVAELFISPLGLSFVSKVAPKNLQGLCQGLWLGATAVGNLLIWIGPLMYNKFPIWQCWAVFFIVCMISMGVMLAMVKWLERVTK